MVLLQTTPTGEQADKIVLLILIICLIVGGGSMLIGWLTSLGPNADLLSSDADADDLDAAVESELPGIAMGNNGTDNGLWATIGNAHNTAEVDRMIEQRLAEAVAALYDQGLVTNMAKAICAVFRCSTSSREGSTYQRALAFVEPLSAKYQEKAAPKPPARGEVLGTIPHPAAARGMNSSLVIHADGHGGQVVPTQNGYVPLDEFLRTQGRPSYEVADLELDAA